MTREEVIEKEMLEDKMIEKVLKYCKEKYNCRDCIIDKNMGCFTITQGTDEQLTRACELIDNEKKVFTPGTEKLILNNFLKGSRR